MMNTLKIVVPGLPIGKGAARHTRKGFTYTPTKTRHYMQEIKAWAMAAGAKPHDVPCIVEIRAYFPIPESYSNKKQKAIRAGEVYFTKKPDTDNLSKIKDALTGLAFRDDAQVFHENITKYFSDNPRLEIDVHYCESPMSGFLGYMS